MLKMPRELTDKQKSDMREKLLKYLRLSAELKKCDNKKLCWFFINTPSYQNADAFSAEDAIFDEITNRLFPEYDGENVIEKEWGWKTPDSDIIYAKEKR